MIIPETEEVFQYALQCTNKPINELNVLELGDMVIKNCLGVQGKQYAKDWFNASNCASHVSFDINGKGGALPLDLSQIHPQYDNSCDLCTNGGTAEHVADPYNAFLNMHNWLKVGGIAVTWGPILYHSFNHSPWAYNLHFPFALAQYSEYSLMHQDIVIPIKGRNPEPVDNSLIIFVIRKDIDHEFIDRTTWNNLGMMVRRSNA